jgi:cytidylate kinase
MIIAIDGPAASGKGTLGKRLAAHYRLRHLDTGLLYRAVAIGEAASVLSAIPAVRAALLALQRNFARTAPGAVLDGRDIGTVICPDAEVKIFVTAKPEVRARRRVLEFQARGEPVEEADVLADILRRDERDSARAVAPLRPAADAHVLDTTTLNADAAFRAAVKLVDSHRGDRL